MNKRQTEIYKRYQDSTMYWLGDAYPSGYSYEKGRAWQYCIDLMHEKGGSGLKVISKNTFQFSAGFEYWDNETGKDMFVYITKSYDREWEV